MRLLLALIMASSVTGNAAPKPAKHAAKPKKPAAHAAPAKAAAVPAALPKDDVRPLDVARIRDAAVSARKKAADLRKQAEAPGHTKGSGDLVKRAKGLEALAAANEALADVEELRTEAGGTFEKLAVATKEAKGLFESLK